MSTTIYYALQPIDLIVGETYRVIGNGGYFDKAMKFVKVDVMKLLHFKDVAGYPYVVSSASVETHYVTLVKWRGPIVYESAVFYSKTEPKTLSE